MANKVEIKYTVQSLYGIFDLDFISHAVTSKCNSNRFAVHDKTWYRSRSHSYLKDKNK